MKIFAFALSVLFLNSAHADETVVADQDLGITVTQTDAAFSDNDGQLVLSELGMNEDLYNVKGTPVKVQQLTFMGRGTYSPKTGESLVVACVGKVEEPTTGQRACDQLQFVLIDAKKQATWASVPFFYGSQKQFKKLMKILEKESRASLGLHPDSKQLVGCLIGFGAAGAVAATVSSGAGLLTLGVLTVLMVTNKKDWRMFDFISPLPRLVIATANERPFLATSDKDGWNWSSHPVRMKAGKFRRLKDLLNHTKSINGESITVSSSID